MGSGRRDDIRYMIMYRLGKTGLQTSRLALGCAKFGSLLSDVPRPQLLRLVDEAYRLGIRHFDTADIYGQGDSERILGEALDERRGEVIIASKNGQRFSANQTVSARFKAPLRILARRLPGLKQVIAQRRARALETDFRPDYLTRALEASLSRLRTDYLDLYYLHSPPVATIAAGDAFATLDVLRRQGKIRCWGVSCDTIEQAEAAVAQAGMDVLQMTVDDLPRDAAVLRAAQANGIAVVARMSSLPTPATHQERAGRMQSLIARQGIASVLVGTTNISHLRENVAAADGHNAAL